MDKGLRNGIFVVGSLAALVTAGAVYMDVSASKRAGREINAWIDHHNSLVDACDAAYNQGRFAKYASLADEARGRYRPSKPQDMIYRDDGTTIVVIRRDKQVCRVDNTTYKVLEKL